jgi:phosphate:Na+ symporter
MTINHGNILGEFPAMMSLAGLGMGTAIATYFLSSNLRGIPRQIAMYQGVTNLAAGIILGVLLLVERVTGVPMLLAFADKLSAANSGRMALMYLFLNLIIAVVAIGGLRWAPAWLARRSPPTREEDLSRPMYLQAEALASPEIAPELVVLEQMRLLHVLQEYMDAARGNTGHQIKALHSSALSLGQEISHFLETIAREPISSYLAGRIISLQRKEETIRALEENVFLFAETLEHRPGDLFSPLVEGLDTLLLITNDALKSKEPLDVEMLVSITDDRGVMMERLRSRHRPEEAGRADEVAALHYATTLFERIVWLLRQLALWMREDVKISEV